MLLELLEYSAFVIFFWIASNLLVISIAMWWIVSGTQAQHFFCYKITRDKYLYEEVSVQPYLILFGYLWIHIRLLPVMQLYVVALVCFISSSQTFGCSGQFGSFFLGSFVHQLLVVLFCIIMVKVNIVTSILFASNGSIFGPLI